MKEPKYLQMMHEWQKRPIYNILSSKIEILQITPKEYGQKLLNRKRGKKWQSIK